MPSQELAAEVEIHSVKLLAAIALCATRAQLTASAGDSPLQATLKQTGERKEYELIQTVKELGD